MLPNHPTPSLPKPNVWRTYKVRHTLVIGGWSLLIFFFYALALFVVTMGITGGFTGYDFADETARVPLWLIVVSLIPVILTTWPVQRWIRRQVAHLLAWEPSNPNSVVNQLAQQIVTAQTVEQLMPTLVQQLATMLDAPYVAIDAEYARLSGAIGDPHATPIVILPLQHGGETLGHLCIAPQELVGMPMQFDARLLADVARQVSLTLWAAQLSVELQASRLRIVSAREEARRQLRHDLHDGLGAGLASITLQADTAMDLVRDDPETAVNILESIIAQTEQTTRELRRIIHDLRPPVLDDVGLSGALHELINTTTPTQFALKLPVMLPVLPAATEVALYRIAQEAITNIIKHAGATQATITLELADETAILTIQDNGQGFVTDGLPGIGLRSMRERAEELGGAIMIQSNQPCGYQVIAQIPL
jgi:two-component system, NarL family, sensor kinase